MKAFLAIKYYDDMRNKNLIEGICQSFENQNIEIFAFARNIQNYGPCNMSGEEVMNLAFSQIKKSDIFIIDASELSIGIGIEAGVALSNNIPIYLIAHKNAYVSNSVKGIAKKSYFYSSPEELRNLKI
ncbi:MAG: hypothetical protein Q4D57_05525 [Clostridia bacterium]|nr:hypothetical protein [Clostridia bacterium]